MAGNRHHSIPQLLQRGFASKKVGDEYFVWQYRLGERGFENNTRNVSVERNFYGKSEETDLDDRITELEPDLARDVQALRKAAKNSPISVESTVAARLVAHFALRTHQLRSGIGDSLMFISNVIESDMQDKAFAEKQLVDAVTSDPAVKQMLRQKLLDEGLPPDKLDEALAAIEPELPGFFAALVHAPNSPLNDIMAPYLQAIRDMTPSAAKQSHIDALSANLNGVERMAFYQTYQWFVIATEEPLILSDSVCIFEIPGDRPFRPLDLEIGDATAIYLPLASHALLYGSLAPLESVDVDQLNQAAARCSQSFFISSQPIDHASPLLSEQGIWAGLVQEHELKQLLENNLKGDRW